ncbi:MAG: hypothetical protein Q9175_004418 [Cornicularia normoerica]
MNARISPATHFNGAAALIQWRKNSRKMTELSKRILIAVRSNIVSLSQMAKIPLIDSRQVFRAIRLSYPVDTASGIWEEDLDDMPRNPASSLDLMSVEVADLLADATYTSPKVVDLSDEEDSAPNGIPYPGKALTSGDFRRSPPSLILKSPGYGVDELLERAQAIDASLAFWPETLPLHWYPVRVFKDTIPQEVIDAGIYEGSCEIYPDIMICSTWNDWRVARLRVLRLIAELCLVSRLDRGETGADTIKKIQQLVDGICASVPFCLGSRTEAIPLYQAEVIYPGLKGRLISKEHRKTASAYGGWYLVSPCKETLELGPYISKGQQEWLQAQLWRLAKLYDVKPT